MIAGRLIVGRSRTDIHVLAHVSAEQLDVALYLFRQKTNKFADCIKELIADLSLHIVRVVDVGNDLSYVGRHFVFPIASVEEP